MFILWMLFPAVVMGSCPLCPTGGIWSEWMTVEKCATDCGACSNITYSRTCLSIETDPICACEGDSTTKKPCNTQACNFPRANSPTKPCCDGSTPVLFNNWYHCGKVEDLNGTASYCCPDGGIWGEWTAWSKEDKRIEYSRTRICVSGGFGCNCDGNAKETKFAHIYENNFSQMEMIWKSCGPKMYPKTLVIQPHYHSAIVPVDTEMLKLNFVPLILGFIFLISFSTAADCPRCPTGGIWSEWVPSGTCATTCGACSQIKYTRKCLSEDLKDCKCSGPSTETKLCGTQACNFPRTSGTSPPCCSGSPMIINNWYYCANASTPTTTTYCCPTGGIWGDWSPWVKNGNAVEYTRNRSCLSGGFNCNCDGETEETKYSCPCAPLQVIKTDNNPCASLTTKTLFNEREPAYFPASCTSTANLEASNFRRVFYIYDAVKNATTCTTGFVDLSGKCTIAEFATGNTDTNGLFWRFTFQCNMTSGGWFRTYGDIVMKDITHIAQFF